MKFDTSSQITTELVHARVSAYYTAKLREHGPTPKGVDWRDQESQEERFANLMKVVEDDSSGTLVELGCGYGALYDYLRRLNLNFTYHGYDISEEMVAAAKNLHAGASAATFEVGGVPRERSDYCVASGIFNVRLDTSIDDWRRYIFSTVELMAAVADKGFAFNCLTSFSDLDRQEPRLFYGDPGEILNHCIARYGRLVSILHGRPPYEFTVLVRHGSPAK